ncbi:pyridoxamine 5'-phosphate oxidase family protein [Deefgea sp. CFH1-16]|uniref:pyridoxamine 5'-phosphate oxidase family protein n=1 Tax=Deefgea sp. CFH1-16 TaxID=2675457 RepID=UPI0015F5D9DA|nr:pyridoxamine 5'-phosphate oxidase family protein [Deefgea sp. CFH1-16]MBM5573181.1 hypothetical protein [Deefgea sp. CFH1-16]
MSSIANHPHDVHDPEQTEDSCNSPFHLGEQQLQIVAGVRDQIERSGRKGIRRHMLEQHQLFYSQLHFVVISALDQDGQPWGTILTGVPGFVRALDDAHLYVGSLPGIDEPLCGALTVGCSIGLLGIELDTRRRNRLNGVVSELDSHGFCIEVMQSFGNCPKYIQQREFGKQINSLIVRTSDVLAQLDSEATSLIQRADTFFIATHAQGIDQQIDAPYGTDVSHRGGKPGFVRVV